jgi:hypothetical protein
MSAKKPIPLPTSRAKVAKGAMAIAVTLLQDERVREQLRKAPETARRWAEQRRDRSAAPDADGSDIRARLDPTQRFGQKGIERRLAALRRNVELVFPDGAGPDAATIVRALDELDRAAAISATMPLRDRRRAHARISAEAARLETALVDAVLP